jgi:hypothetical protein
MRTALMIVMLACISSAFATGEKRETMCVKQKDGTYKCRASGKVEKEPCCDTPSNDPKPTPRPKK